MPMPNPDATIRLTLSQLAPATIQSEIRAMTLECDHVGGINLAQGICDTPVPAAVEEGAIQAIRDGQNIYTRLDGISRLRNAISAKQKRDYGLDYDPESEILVSSGATGGLHAAAMEEATFLTRFGDTITLVHRNENFRASKIMLDRARANDKIKFLTNTVVEDVYDVTKNLVTGVKLRDLKTNRVWDQEVDG